MANVEEEPLVPHEFPQRNYRSWKVATGVAVMMACVYLSVCACLSSYNGNASPSIGKSVPHYVTSKEDVSDKVSDDSPYARRYRLLFDKEALTDKTSTTLLRVASHGEAFAAVRATVGYNGCDYEGDLETNALVKNTTTRMTESSYGVPGVISWGSPIYNYMYSESERSRSGIFGSIYVYADDRSCERFALTTSDFWIEAQERLQFDLTLYTCPPGFVLDYARKCSIELHSAMTSAENSVSTGKAFVSKDAPATLMVESLMPTLGNGTSGVFANNIRISFTSDGDSVDWSKLWVKTAKNYICSAATCVDGIDLSSESDGGASVSITTERLLFGSLLSSPGQNYVFQLMSKDGYLDDGAQVPINWKLESVGCTYESADLEIPTGKDVSPFDAGVKVGAGCDIPLVQARLGAKVEIDIASKEYLVFMVEVPPSKPIRQLRIHGPTANYLDLCIQHGAPVFPPPRHCREPDDFNDGIYTINSPLSGFWYFGVKIFESSVVFQTETTLAEQDTVRTIDLMELAGKKCSECDDDTCFLNLNDMSGCCGCRQV